MLEQQVFDHPVVGVSLQNDHDPHSVAVGLVTNIGDILEDAVFDQIGDAFDERRLVDLVGDLGDHDRLAATLRFFDTRPRPDDDPPAARLVRFLYPQLAQHHARRRKIRPLDQGE